MGIYIAGPMRGHPGFNFQAFYNAEFWLRGRGERGVIFNPARRDVEKYPDIDFFACDGSEDLTSLGFDLEDAMQADLDFIASEDCDEVVVLPGWSTSRGSWGEMALAEELDLPISYVEPWDGELFGPETELDGDPTTSDHIIAFEILRYVADVEREPVHVPAGSIDRINSAMAFPAPALSGEVRTASASGGEKGVKPERMSLIPMSPLRSVARVYGFGATKYAADNWRKGYEWSKSMDALLRHATAPLTGQWIDEESGEPHLAHAVFHCFALMQWAKDNPEFNDLFELPEVNNHAMR